MVLQINKLPNDILIGRQTENGVNEIEIDVSEWLEHWPGMNISIMHTRPGETYAYPAATHMNGSHIVWEISNADTAIHGLGTAEIMGILDGKKKLSRIVQTHISKTTTATTSDIPEAAKPWVDGVLDAAHRAEEAANEIKGMNVEVQTLEPGTQATAEWDSGLLKLGIPAGQNGDANVSIASRKTAGVVIVGDNMKIDDNGVLSVDTADTAEQDNTRPITSAAVHTEIGNIEILLSTI